MPGRLAGLHVAEAAAASADVAEDHERGGAALPALADVGAVGLLADRVEVVLLDRLLQAAVGRPAGRRDLEPGRLAGAEVDLPVDVRGAPARVGPGAGDVDSIRDLGSLAHRSYRTGAASPTSSASASGSTGDRLPPVDLREALGDGVDVVVHLLLGAQLPAERCHPAVLDATGHDPLERLQVVVDVDREAVGGDATIDVHPDGADLAPLGWTAADPDAGEAIDHLGVDPDAPSDVDHQPLEPPDVLVDVVPVGPQRNDRIAHQLAGPVVGDAAAAVGLADLDSLHPVPVLAHAQLTRLRAAALRVDGRVLEQKQHVWHPVGLAGRLDPLLHPAALLVGNQPAADDQDLIHSPIVTCVMHRLPGLPPDREARTATPRNANRARTRPAGRSRDPGTPDADGDAAPPFPSPSGN